MSDRTRTDRRRPPGSLLSAGELSARRAAWHRRRARRRGAFLLIVVVAAAVVAVVALNRGGGSAPGRVATDPSRTAGGAHLTTRRRSAVTRLRQGGQTQPVDRVLRYTSYVRLAARRRRDVALTFDDGPSGYTPEILRVLRRMHAPATFFVIGRWALAYPRLVADEVRARSEVGDHTQNHPPLAELSPAAQTAEIRQAGDAIHRAGAPYPVLLRPPYGSFNQSTLQVLRAQGMPRIITRLRQRGYHLVTVSQLIADDPPPASQPPPRPLSGGF